MSQDTASSALVGRVAGVVRYPVKSALGQPLHHVALTETGLAGDRRLAVIDQATGRVASAKNPRLWRALLSVTAYLPTTTTPGEPPSTDRVRLTLPDGATLTGAGPDLDQVLSRLLDRPVRLTRTPPPAAVLDRAVPEQVIDAGLHADVEVEALTMGQASPPGTFVDYAPIHLPTTATIEQISDLAGHLVDPRRYRPNLLIETPDGDTGFIENHWIGCVLAIGDTAQLRVVMATPRCAVPTLDHGHGRDLDAVRTLTSHNRLDLPDFGWQPCAGAYAHIVHPGTVAVGDPVRLLRHT